MPNDYYLTYDGELYHCGISGMKCMHLNKEVLTMACKGKSKGGKTKKSGGCKK